MKSLCDMFQEPYLDELQVEVEDPVYLDSEDMKTVIHKALLKMQKRQQDKDRDAFTVVAGAGVAAWKLDFAMAETGGRERASTGLLAVGGDVLSFISTFLSWEKVKLQREWKVPAGDVVRSCHIWPCSRMILTSSGDALYCTCGMPPAGY